MNNHDWFDQIDQIDQTWDDIVTNSGHTRRGDTMTETMLRLHHLAAETVPTQTLDRVWNHLAVSSAPTASRSRRRIHPLRLLWGALESRPMSAVATVALLVLVMLSGYFSISGNRTVAPSDEVNYRLLIRDAASSSLQEIDALTLAYVPNGLTYPFKTLASPTADRFNYMVDRWLASADGTRLIGLVNPGPVSNVEQDHSAIIVVDPKTGTELLRFPIAAFSSSPVLNASGSRVAVQIEGGFVGLSQTSVITNSPVRWDIYDTATGQLLSKIEAENDRDPTLFGSGWFSPTGRIFYRFSIDDQTRYPGPWSVQLVAHDAQTGQERARLDLPDVRVGYWPSESPDSSPSCHSNQGPTGIEGSWQIDLPGVAISPDGATMAIVHPDGPEITMVDLPATQVTRTLTLPESAPASPVAVDDAQCPLQFDRVRGALFSPDGASLYVTGVDLPAMDPALRTVINVPLMRIDVATGTVAESVTVDGTGLSSLDWSLVQSPDGRNLYTMRYAVRGGATTIERRDPETLAILAMREYVSPREIIGTVVK